MISESRCQHTKWLVPPHLDYRVYLCVHIYIPFYTQGAENDEKLIISHLGAACYNLHATFNGRTAMIHIYIVVFNSIHLADKKING